MPAPSGDKPVARGPSSRLSQLGIVLPVPPTPLGGLRRVFRRRQFALPQRNASGGEWKARHFWPPGRKSSVKEGQEAARIASLNALAAAQQHLGNLDRLKKVVKLTVLMATAEQFTEHAQVADGASNLFVQIFGSAAGHVRLVYGVQSLPVGAPVIVDNIFEIEPLRDSTSKLWK